jgi:hypothetical protein
MLPDSHPPRKTHHSGEVRPRHHSADDIAHAPTLVAIDQVHIEQLTSASREDTPKSKISIILLPSPLRLLLNGAVASLAIFLAWYMAILYFNNFKVLDHEWRALAWSVVLAALWVPTTLYSRWYFSEFSLSWLANSPFFVFLSVVFFAGAIVLVLLNLSSGSAAAVLGLQGAIPVIVGTLTKIKPQYMRKVGEFFSSLPFMSYLLVVAMVMSVAQGVSALIVANSRFDNTIKFLELAGKPPGQMGVTLSINGKTWFGQTSEAGDDTSMVWTGDLRAKSEEYTSKGRIFGCCRAEISRLARAPHFESLPGVAIIVSDSAYCAVEIWRIREIFAMVCGESSKMI